MPTRTSARFPVSSGGTGKPEGGARGASPRALRPSLVLIALTALVAGCSLGPDREVPKVAMPPAWDSAATATVWPDARWWESFGSPELNRLIAEAEAGNTDLAAAVIRVRQAQAQSRIAGAALLPTFGLDGGASRAWTDVSGSGSRSGNAMSKSYDAGFVAGYQVDLFGGNAASADAARTQLEANRYDRETVALTVQSEVASAYLTILAIRDRTRLSQETLRIAESILGMLNRQLELGVASELEVAQQRASVAQQRASLPGLEQSEREALTGLAVLLGRAPQGFQVQGRSLDELRLPVVGAGLPSTLLERRPDLRRAEADLRAANLDVVSARAARFPTLDLSARGSIQSAMLSFDPFTLARSVAASVSAPIFEGGRLQAQEDLAAARADETAEVYRKAVITALQDTENALSATDTSARQEGFAREAHAQAREALRIVEARFRNGTVDFLNVLEAQRTVFQTSDTTVQATLGRYNAALSLYRALGGGWSGTVQ